MSDESDSYDILFGPMPPFRKCEVDSRQLNMRVVELYTIARKLNLSYPLGRALYAVNRLYNGWPWVYPGPNFEFRPHHLSPLDLMRRTRESTAKRWREHWARGGGLQTIGRTHAEQLEFRRMCDKKRRDEYRRRGVI